MGVQTTQLDIIPDKIVGGIINQMVCEPSELKVAVWAPTNMECGCAVDQPHFFQIGSQVIYDVNPQGALHKLA